MKRSIGCEQVQGRLAALRDGECRPAETARIEAHLAGCLDCARLREEQEQVHQAAGAWQVKTADLWPTLQARIESEANREALEALRGEIARLRDQVRSLEAEVALLRRETTERPFRPSAQPSPLLPYSAPSSRTLHLA